MIDGTRPPRRAYPSRLDRHPLNAVLAAVGQRALVVQSCSASGITIGLEAMAGVLRWRSARWIVEGWDEG